MQSIPCYSHQTARTKIYKGGIMNPNSQTFGVHLVALHLLDANSFQPSEIAPIPPTGFEPVTVRLEGGCSILLS